MYALTYFNDDLKPNARVALAPAHRIVYVAEGGASVNGREVGAQNGVYTNGNTTIAAGPKGATLYRWDLVQQGTAPALAKGDGAASVLRMAQDIWSFDIPPGSRWLYRLDMIDNPAGVVADVHTHPGPGIRALLYGTFHVRQPSEDGAATKAGDPWWESGVEAVISTPSATEDSGFLRCMVLPTEYAGRPDTAKWLRKPLRIKSTWKLYVDEIVTL